MSVSSSISCLIVWASLSLAFINYTRWYSYTLPRLVDDYILIYTTGSRSAMPISGTTTENSSATTPTTNLSPSSVGHSPYPPGSASSAAFSSSPSQAPHGGAAASPSPRSRSRMQRYVSEWASCLLPPWQLLMLIVEHSLRFWSRYGFSASSLIGASGCG